MAKHNFQVLGQQLTNTTWNGQPTTLLQNQSVGMPQTTNGTMIFAATNQATVNNQGDLGLTSGGGAPQFITIPALANQPTVLISNWQANNLNVTNTSPATATPILVQAIGPGLPGITPLSLEIGKTLEVGPGQVAQGNASPQYMQLVITSNSPTLGIIGIIGGPQDASGNNGYIIAVNASANTGPGGATPPAGYFATTTSNAYAFPFNWGSSVVFAGNLSPSTAQVVSLFLRAL
jgi:hypothetical protein